MLFAQGSGDHDLGVIGLNIIEGAPRDEWTAIIGHLKEPTRLSHLRMPNAIAIRASLGATRLTTPGDSATLPPLSVPTSATISVEVDFDDGTTKMYDYKTLVDPGMERKPKFPSPQGCVHGSPMSSVTSGAADRLGRGCWVGRM